MRHRQQGYFLVVAVIFILVMGVMGSIIAYLFSSRGLLSAAQLQGLRAFYMAESGLEIGTRYLSRPSFTAPARTACANITGNAQLTNAALSNGTFTLSTVSSPGYAVSTLSSGITAASALIPLSSVSGLSAAGRVMIDKEKIDYAGISGTTLLGATRGVDGTMASIHVSGASVGQYQCTLDSQAGIPMIAAPTYARELRWDVQLQDGWAAADNSGNNFILTRWNYPTEISWNAASVAGGSNSADLNAVSMLSNADGWAVGDEANNNLIFLRWNGSAWSLTTVARNCNAQNLLGVSSVSSRQAWAVGVRCGNGANRLHTIMYWNGGTWVRLSPAPAASPNMPAGNNNNQNLNAVHAIDTDGDGLANVGFAVGNSGQIVQFNGTNWVLVSSPTTQNLFGVYVVSAVEAWAVGNNGTLLRWNGSTWSTYSSSTTTNLRAIAMLDTDGDGLANMGFAVGISGRIISYNGSSWSSVDMGAMDLFGVSIINSQDAWAVGTNGSALHWNGSNWSSVSTGVSQNINGISLLPEGSKPMSAWRQIFR